MNNPENRFYIDEIGVCRSKEFFFYFCSNHALLILIRTSSVRFLASTKGLHLEYTKEHIRIFMQILSFHRVTDVIIILHKCIIQMVSLFVIQSVQNELCRIFKGIIQFMITNNISGKNRNIRIKSWFDKVHLFQVCQTRLSDRA